MILMSNTITDRKQPGFIDWNGSGEAQEANTSNQVRKARTSSTSAAKRRKKNDAQ